jgi:hypothetical protein
MYPVYVCYNKQTQDKHRNPFPFMPHFFVHFNTSFIIYITTCIFKCYFSEALFLFQFSLKLIPNNLRRIKEQNPKTKDQIKAKSNEAKNIFQNSFICFNKSSKV